MRSIALVFAGFVCTTLASQSALAHDRPVVVSLDGGTCVAQSELRDAVGIRGGKISDDANVRLRVRVAPRSDGQVDVEIAGEGAHGPLAARRLVASSCKDAVDALGLVVTLAADDDDRDAREEAAAPPADPTVAAVAAPTLVTRDRVADETKPSSPSAFALRASAIGTTFGEGALGARLGGALEWKRTFLPWIEASATMTFPHTIDGGGGGADARWITGRLAAAPIGANLGESWRLILFGAFDAGTLGVSGSGPARVADRSRAWLAIAAGARVRADLGPRFFAGLDFATVVPLVRDDFVFVNGGSVYRVPVAGAETAIFAGAHFP